MPCHPLNFDYSILKAYAAHLRSFVEVVANSPIDLTFLIQFYLINFTEETQVSILLQDYYFL